MKNMVSKEWLLDNIKNDDLIILDVRSDLMDLDKGFNEYKEAHIEKAQYLPLKGVLAGKEEDHGGRHPIPTIDKFVEHMKDVGITDSSTVVVYDDGGMMSGRLLWLLRYIGKENVYILEGGINLWRDSGYPLTKEIVTSKKSNSLSVKINEEIKVDMNYVKEAIEKDNVVLIDSRAPERYRGEIEPIDKIAGHIPSALNFPWEETQSIGINKGIEGLKEHFKPLEKFDEIIVYCGSGVSGSVNVIFMEEVGLKPKLYAGSYSDWISYKDNIVGKS